MMELLTSAQMRGIERAAIDSGAVTGLDLMERAGQAVVGAILSEWPDLRAAPGRAVVLCGPGNNGGDGFVIARLLESLGWEIDLWLYGGDSLPPDAATNRDRWAAIGGIRRLTFPRMTEEEAAALGDAVSAPGVTLVVDALFGTGLTRPVVPALARLFGRIAGAAGAHRVAVDIPTGLCADSGFALRGDAEGPGALPAFRADLTVTFHARKLGHVLAEGPEHCGRLVRGGIGLETTGESGAARLTEAPRDIGKAGGHKFAHGHALVLAGGPGRGGAARMAARGALRMGAGLVTVGCPPAALQENAAALDAVMLRSLRDADALTAMLEDDRLNALCLGPGLGLSDDRAEMVGAALAARRATVLDADALTLLAREPELFGRLHADCVLTPHGGEFARLFPDIAARLDPEPTEGPAFSRVDAARAAAARAGCTLLYKGPDTVIADPDGAVSVNAAVYDRAAPWLATAGAGDVLSGFIAGLLARGLAPKRAAEAGAWLHVECALSFGPGLIAEDLPERLPAVFRALSA